MKYIFFILFFGSFCTKPQNTISGIVNNSNGEKIIFASIYLDAQKKFAHSTQDGFFTLKIENKKSFKDTLVVKFIGYNTVKIPIYYQGKNIELDRIILTTKNNLLPEIDIIPPPPVEKILSLTLKRIKKNYIDSDTDLDGFYRETSLENGTCVMLNEAVINVRYSKYSNKINMHKGFRDYYKNQETNLKNSGNIFRYTQFFPFYTTKEDLVHIPFSRKSFNLSKFKNNPAPYGGPNDLLAMDKVKFLYDFLDPKMFATYNYKNLGKVNVDDVICYKIAYSPKIQPQEEKQKKVWHPINQKMKQAVFAGFIYINIADYTVTCFEGQKYILANFSIYDRPYPYFSYPDFLYFKVTYQKNKKGKYVLSTVAIDKTRNIKYGNEMIRYQSKRFLRLYDSQQKNKKMNNKQFLYGNNTSFRNFVEHYDKSFWKVYEKSTYYPPLTNQYKLDLEAKNSLNNQFLNQNKLITDFKSPDITEVYQKIQNQTDSNQYYIELKAKYDSLLENYILKENQYYNTVMEKLKTNKRFYSYYYFHAFRDQKVQDKLDYFILDNEKICSKIDSNNHEVWYTYNSNEKIIDLSLLSFKKMNYFLEDVKLNKSKKIAATYSERGEISYQLVVLEYGSDSTSYTTDHVRDFFWISDSTLLYTKTDLTERPFQVLKTNVNTKKTDILFSLNDNEKELELTNNKKGTLLKIQNYDDTECLILNTENNIFESRVSKNKETQINLTFFDNKKVIINEIGDTHLLRFGKINAKNYLNLPIIYKSTGIIEEVKNTKDYIIFTERLEGNYHLKTINLKNNTVRTIKNIPKYSSITIDQTTEEKNEILFSVEGALTPYYQIKLNVEFNKLDTTHQDVVSADFNLTDFTYEYTEIAINDSINIPITILYKTELKDSLKGLLIKTYGTYNSFDFPTYNVDQLIYATAGVGVAFVHPRGSGEKGKNWYINGKKMNKKNTFSDYISSVEALKNLYNLKRNQIIGYGSSAGGLTIGVAANLRADLFGGLIFDKPYINIIDVMNNPNLPLTTLEYSEFGNINDTTVYNYVKSYAPLENIKEENYPNILVFNKYHDMNTPYWNVVKGTVNYRKLAINNPLILMSTDLEAGHRGNVNHLIEIDYRADMFAFILFTINKK